MRHHRPTPRSRHLDHQRLHRRFLRPTRSRHCTLRRSLRRRWHSLRRILRHLYGPNFRRRIDVHPNFRQYKGRFCAFCSTRARFRLPTHRLPRLHAKHETLRRHHDSSQRLPASTRHIPRRSRRPRYVEVLISFLFFFLLRGYCASRNTPAPPPMCSLRCAHTAACGRRTGYINAPAIVAVINAAIDPAIIDLMPNLAISERLDGAIPPIPPI